ncbi:MAG: NAD-dependent epimerase/dehydratase family protein [Armatimonadota bacterium]
MAQKVLVTGATGFAGSHLTKHLVDEGFDVRILARSSGDISKQELAGAEVITGDMTDKDSIKRAVKGVDTIYNIAALYRLAGFPDSAYWAVNFEGAKNIFLAAIEEGVRRVVHCSTVGVTSHIANPPGDENTPYSPGDVYQESKCAAEQLALQLHSEVGFPVSVIRPAGIYGPGDTRWLKMFKSINRRRFPIIGSGQNYLHLVYVSDLVDAFRLAADKPEAVGNVYIAGGEKYVTLKELAVIIAKVMNVPEPKLHIPLKPVRILSGICEDLCRTIHVEPPIFRRRVDFFVKSRAFDITKAKTELGYNPKVGIEDGVRLTADWYKEHNWL